MKNTWTHTSKVSYSDNRWLPPCFMSHHVAQYTPYGPFMYNQIQDEEFFWICGLVDLKDFPYFIKRLLALLISFSRIVFPKESENWVTLGCEL